MRYFIVDSYQKTPEEVGIPEARQRWEHKNGDVYSYLDVHGDLEKLRELIITHGSERFSFDLADTGLPAEAVLAIRKW